MESLLQIRDMRVWPLAVPMRLKFEHAAAARNVADPVVCRIAAAAPHAQHVGYGETLVRPYVTGESVSSVLRDVEDVFLPLLANFHPASFSEALEFIEALPFEDDGRVICGARALVELALLDLAGRVFRRRASDVVGWLGLPAFGRPGCLPKARYSGIVVGRSEWKVKAFLRLQRLYGLRDFKIKVAIDGWEQKLRWAADVLAGPIERGQATLRADANSGWSLSDVIEASPLLESTGVAALEQPMPDSNDEDLPFLAKNVDCDLIADESLLTVGDAERLLQDGVKVMNIRIAKVGGLMPALRIAALTLALGGDVQLGCLVGETSILSAAGVAFLEACPKVRFVEGAFGRWLLKNDVVRKPVQFGRGGLIKPMPGFGLGIDVDFDRVERLAIDKPIVWR